MNSDLALRFLDDPAWDSPFFKRLAHNDTGQAVGHQGGIVIPKDLRTYFPTLDEGLASAFSPTVDRYLLAEMFVPSQQIGSDTIRYQFQTWGGTRSAESRLTDNLGPIRNKAHENDLLIMQRSRDRVDCFRLLLVRETDPEFERFSALARGRRWGALYPQRLPMSQQELTRARKEMMTEATSPFVAVRGEITRVATMRSAIARDTAFRETLLVQYHRQCSVSRIALTTKVASEVQAAHVVGLGRGGADEPRNGFTLTGTLHWAFDRGLFGVGDDRKVVVPPRARAISGNEWLIQFHGKEILEAAAKELRTAPEAFMWHRENILSQWN